MPDVKNVFFPDDSDIVCFDFHDLERIKTAARMSELLRARFCLHLSPEDKVQQMVLAFCAGTEVPVHRHRNRTESFHVIEGQLEVLIFDDRGIVTESIKMGPIESGLTFLYRINKDAWHTVKPLTEIVIIHEVVAGPYEKMEILKNE